MIYVIYSLFVLIEKLFEEFLGTLESRILPGNPVQRLRNIRVEPATAWVLMEYLCYLQ